MDMNEGIETWKIHVTYTIHSTTERYALQKLNQALRTGNAYTYQTNIRIVKAGETTKKPKMKNNPWLKEIARQIFKSK